MKRNTTELLELINSRIDAQLHIPELEISLNTIFLIMNNFCYLLTYQIYIRTGKNQYFIFNYQASQVARTASYGTYRFLVEKLQLLLFCQLFRLDPCLLLVYLDCCYFNNAGSLLFKVFFFFFFFFFLSKHCLQLCVATVLHLLDLIFSNLSLVFIQQ